MSNAIARTNWRHWVKKSDNFAAKTVRQAYFFIKDVQFPVITPVHKVIYLFHSLVARVWHATSQLLYWTPLFKSVLRKKPKRLHLYSGMPQVIGALDIDIGEGTRVSGQSSFIGRSSSATKAELMVGRNVDIGWQTTIAVGTKVVLEDNVRMAGRVFLAGFPGHPVDPIARANGDADTPNQIGDIYLKENVWLASGVTVLAGVTIGRNTIVGTGSVVTKDLPDNVIAAGVPAKIVSYI